MQGFLVSTPLPAAKCEELILHRHEFRNFCRFLPRLFFLFFLIVLVSSNTGSMALLRAIIFLFGKEPPRPRAEVIRELGIVTGIETDIFKNLLMLKAGTIRPSGQEIRALFERYYAALESFEKIVDDLHV